MSKLFLNALSLSNFKTYIILFLSLLAGQISFAQGSKCIDLFGSRSEFTLPNYNLVEKGSFAERAVKTERIQYEKLIQLVGGLKTTITGIENWAYSKEGWNQQHFAAGLDRFVQHQVNILLAKSNLEKARKGQKKRDMDAFLRNSFTANSIETTEMSPNEASLYSFDLPKEVQLLIPIMDSLVQRFDKKYLSELELALRGRALAILFSYANILTPEQLHIYIKADFLRYLQLVKMLKVENSIHGWGHEVNELFMNLTDQLAELNEFAPQVAQLRLAMSNVQQLDPQLWDKDSELLTAMKPFGPQAITTKKNPELINSLRNDLIEKIFTNKSDLEYTKKWVAQFYPIIKKLKFEMSLGFVSPKLELWRNYRSIRFLILQLAEVRLYNHQKSNHRDYTFDDMYAMLIKTEWDYLPQFSEPHMQAMFETVLIRLKDMTDEYQFLMVMLEIAEKHPDAFK